MGLGEISLGEMGLGEMGLGEMGQNLCKRRNRNNLREGKMGVQY